MVKVSPNSDGKVLIDDFRYKALIALLEDANNFVDRNRVDNNQLYDKLLASVKYNHSLNAVEGIKALRDLAKNIK